MRRHAARSQVCVITGGLISARHTSNPHPILTVTHQKSERLRIPQGMIDKANQIAADQAKAGTYFAFCGVPVAELTEEEARAALIYTLDNLRKYIGTNPFG